MFDDKEFDKKRTQNNQELMKLLSELSAKNPSLRFSQLLAVFGFVEGSEFEKPKYWKNEFSLEPEYVLKRVQSTTRFREKSINN